MVRKLTAFVAMLVLSVVLVACTGDDEDPEPTVAPTEPAATTRIFENTPESTAETAIGTAVDTVIGTPVADEATPVVVASPVGATPVATPVVTEATVMPAASPAGTPAESGAAVVPPPAVETPVARIEMTGTVVLNGVANEAFVLTDAGCVGLGEHNGLHADRQVVVRNENGTIVSVTTLEPADDADGCAWEFVAAVPESEFYSVSVPMEFERVFPGAEVDANDGHVEIEVP